MRLQLRRVMEYVFDGVFMYIFACTILLSSVLKPFWDKALRRL